MDKETSYLEGLFSTLANIISIITSISGIIVSIKLEYFWIIIPFVLIIIFNILFLSHYWKKMKYINFIEYLFNNNNHRFTLLPKFRIYIENKKRKNQIHIKELKIKYIISRNPNYDDIIADLKIEYQLKIKNKKLPKQYYIIFGNDYAERKPHIEYSICNNPMASVTFIEAKHSEYERGIINEAVINLEHDNLPKKEFELKITHSYENSFNFSVTNTYTLILLPLLYGNKIDIINYEINFQEFNDYPEFYCNAYYISQTKKFGKNYDIKDVSTLLKSSNFVKTISLDKIESESAYYFRIGIDQEKMVP